MVFGGQWYWGQRHCGIEAERSWPFWEGDPHRDRDIHDCVHLVHIFGDRTVEAEKTVLKSEIACVKVLMPVVVQGKEAEEAVTI